MNVVIIRKKIKNMYLRVKDGEVIVTANRFVSNKMINNFVNKNIDCINKMIEKENNNKRFKFLGKNYTIVYIDTEELEIEDDKIYVKNKDVLNKWFSKEINDIFNERIEICKKKFSNIPDFSLRIRNMKTKWGVCNTKLKIVTLNSNLIRYEKDTIDYVIIHELCHFIQPNHSKLFWLEVEKRFKDYKKNRKILKND